MTFRASSFSSAACPHASRVRVLDERRESRGKSLIFAKYIVPGEGMLVAFKAPRESWLSENARTAVEWADVLIAELNKEQA